MWTNVSRRNRCHGNQTSSQLASYADSSRPKPFNKRPSTHYPQINAFCKVSQFFEDMESCFTPAEWSVIYRGRNESDKTKRFFVFWSLKESYIKAVGYVETSENLSHLNAENWERMSRRFIKSIGLGFELKRAEFKLDDEENPTSATVSIDKIARPDWVFEVHSHDVRSLPKNNLIFEPFVDCPV